MCFRKALLLGQCRLQEWLKPFWIDEHASKRFMASLFSTLRGHTMFDADRQDPAGRKRRTLNYEQMSLPPLMPR